ncbi:hypothetical protein Sjap_012587 [Stephania japonica]|uniref:D-lactate dehydrogenase (cytochrome) n=1 Tax=Stephania japonica TaxID=461633 RepID=A0AAP0IXH1_9MAGN
MASFLSSRLARFASSSSSSNRIFKSLLRSSSRAAEIATSNADEHSQRLFSWSSALVPLALAVSAGSIASDDPRTTRYSFCDSQIHLGFSRNGGVGGKESTELVVEGSRREVPRELIEELEAICEDNLTLDYDERFVHGKPQNSFHKAVNIPDIVVFPRSEEEVSKIVICCNKHKVPIVPYGGATSIEGHTLSPSGGVCVDMTLMKHVKALHVEDMDVVVEPGIGWMELNEYLAPYSLFFPLDPGPGATIGGMCATRCSGSLAVRYGTMRDNVINLKVVLANGDIVKTGSRARKSAAGYDLTRLMIGSEGTLGIITEVTLKLQKIPQYSVVSRVELLDEVQVKAINIANGKNLPEVPTLMFEFIGTGLISTVTLFLYKFRNEAYAREQTLTVQKIASEHNGSDFVFAEEPEAKKELWKATSCSFFMQIRKEALWACFAMEPAWFGLETTIFETVEENILFLKKKTDFSFDGKGEFEDEEIYVNFDEPPKFDVGEEGFIEDRVVFGDDGYVIEVIPQSTNPRVLKTVVNDGVADSYHFQKGVETKVKFARTKHFCSLTDDMDEELVVDTLQDFNGGVFVDNFNFKDVCVPLSQLAELISRCKEVLDASPLVCTVIAHAGDGNFHTLILFDPNQEDQRQEAERLNHFIVHAALSLDGTCTGEHGVGTGKMKYLEKELGIEALRTMKKIKGVLDPNNIMNPGKLIPPHVCF